MALDSLLTTFEQATDGWLSASFDAGMALFQRLAAIEIAVFGIVVALKARSAGAAAILPELSWKLFLIGLVLSGILIYPLWLPVLLQGLPGLAGEITGDATINPAEVVARGSALSILVLGRAVASGWLSFSLVPSAIGVIGALGLFLAFFAMGAILFKTLIESWMILAIGPLWLGFAPFRLTAPIADNFLTYSFQVGIKLFLLVLMNGAVQGIATSWYHQLSDPQAINFQLVLEVVAGAGLLAVSLWTVPTRMADVLTRGLDFGLKRALQEA